MSNIAAKLASWLWYLVPANPILVRVVNGMSRRSRHLWLRFGYLSILVAVVTVLLLNGSSTSLSLADFAKRASQTFMWASMTQLALMCFLAPVFTAGAITQERDSQTYNILISTPLTNAQIVIGSLLSRLYFVVVLLLAGLPVFLTTMIYGGVTTGHVFRSFAIAGATAVLTGSLAITISMIKIGTRRTIFSFFLGIAIYLLCVYFLGGMKGTWIPEAPLSPVTNVRMSWLAPFHPFLALEVALNRVQAPDVAAVAEYGSIARYFLAYPSTVYVFLTLIVSVLLTILSVLYARRCTKIGETTLFSKLTGLFRRAKKGSLTRKPHTVWANPVAWREAVTRASATSRGIGRYLVVLCGVLGAVVLLLYYINGWRGFNASATREWLAAIIIIEFAIVLIIATNTAASALTKEKESKTMDIMLTTPLTSGYLIWGKLRGLVSSVVPLIVIPVLSLLIFGFWDLVTNPAEKVAHVETALEVGLLMVIFSAYACMLGLHFSLKQRKTVRAVLLAVGVLLGVNVGVYLFWNMIVTEASVFGVALSSATPFTAIAVLVDPSGLFDPAEFAQKTNAIRVAALTGSLIFIALHAIVVFSWYKAMVRSFDMIIRKQSGL